MALLILAGIQIVLGLIPILRNIASMLSGPIFMVGILTFAHGIQAKRPMSASFLSAARRSWGR